MSVTIIEGAPEPTGKRSSPAVVDPNPRSRWIATVSAKGRIYTQFESIIVHRDFTDGISWVELSVSEADYQPDDKLQPGDRIAVTLGGAKVLTGMVTRRAVAFDATSDQIVITGRSKPGDVHDSSIRLQPGTLDGSTFEQAAKKVCQPHGVGLVMRNPPAIASKPFKSLRIQPGETGGEFIGRLAAARSLFLSDDADGNLVAGCVDQSEAQIGELVQGRNIKSLSGFMNDERAFSVFGAVSQTASPNRAEPARWFSTTATVDGIRPNRYRLFIADQPLEQDELKARNNQEVAASNWETLQASVVVVGWFTSPTSGVIWDVGKNVMLKSPKFIPGNGGVAPPLAIKTVTYSQDGENGTLTTLNLIKREYLSELPTKGVQDLGEGGSGTSDSQPDAPDYTT